MNLPPAPLSPSNPNYILRPDPLETTEILGQASQQLENIKIKEEDSDLKEESINLTVVGSGDNCEVSDQNRAPTMPNYDATCGEDDDKAMQNAVRAYGSSVVLSFGPPVFTYFCPSCPILLSYWVDLNQI